MGCCETKAKKAEEGKEGEVLKADTQDEAKEESTSISRSSSLTRKDGSIQNMTDEEMSDDLQSMASELSKEASSE